MTSGPVKTLAANAARTVRRRLRGGAPVRRVAAEPEPPRAVTAPVVPLPQAPLPDAAEPAADEAQLDALRGALVRELDRLAADDDCSASFRRA